MAVYGGFCYFSMARLETSHSLPPFPFLQAERIFSEVRRIESYRVEGMEIYSTTLWHLQKDVALSALSKDLTDMDKNSPEVRS